MSNDLILNIVGGLVVTLLSFIVGSSTRVPSFFRQWKLKQILNISRNKEIVFLYPPRKDENPRDVVLPRASTEDFMAINNIISALLLIGQGHEQFTIKDTTRFFEQDEKKTLVVFCSPKSNSFAERLQTRLLEQKIKHYHFIEGTLKGNDPEWMITDGDAYYSSSINQKIKKYQKEIDAWDESFENGENENQPRPIHERELTDLAVITKVDNPWNPENKILWIAGVRGIGTWGAAEIVKKWYYILYKQRKGFGLKTRKNGNFSAIVKVHYFNSDIIRMDLLGFISIES